MRHRSITAVALFAVALLTVAACSSDDDSPSLAQDEAPATTAISDEAADARDGVTLEDPGAEPREPLRLRVTPGTTTSTEILTKLTLQLVAQGEELPVGAVPATRLVLEQHVDRVDPDGTIHFTGRFTDVSVVSTPGVDASLIRQTQQAMDDLKGLTITGSTNVRGGAQTVDVDTSQVTDATLKSTLDAMKSQIGTLAAPVPRAAVGRGARWSVKNSATIGGITMNTTTRYTLRSRDGDRYELDAAQQAEAPPGPVELPNVPSSARTSIERFGLTSEGTVTGNLTRLLPERSSMTGSGGGDFSFSAEGQSGRLTQNMTIELTVSAA